MLFYSQPTFYIEHKTVNIVHVNLVGDDQYVPSVVPLHSGRSLEDLVSKVEVEVKHAVSVVIRTGAEQTHASVSGVGDDHLGVVFVGGRHSAGALELIRTAATATEPAFIKKIIGLPSTFVTHIERALSLVVNQF